MAGGRRSSLLASLALLALTAAHSNVDIASVFAKTPATMNLHDRITLDPQVLAGKPVIRGTRLAVDFIVGLLAQDWSEADLLRNYPGLTHADIAACLQYASDLLQAEKVYPLETANAA